jgi:hypothetical protein
MTPRTISIVFLFVAAVAASGLALALAAALGARLDWTMQSWMVQVVMFLSFVGVFFFGRSAVLPLRLARSATRSLLTLSLWMAATLTAGSALTWVASPIMRRVGVGSGALPILLVCLLGSVAILDRASRTSRT